jgi:Ras-related protein Rab-21
MARQSQNNFKIVLLGEGRVGKTSLVLRYINNVFSDKQQSTVQASFLTKRLSIGDRVVNLAIWDTAGQERFHALGPIYYRDADGALLVYDTTDSDSFAKVKNWVKELRKMVGQDIVLCIAGEPRRTRISSTCRKGPSLPNTCLCMHPASAPPAPARN